MSHSLILKFSKRINNSYTNRTTIGEMVNYSLNSDKPYPTPNKADKIHKVGKIGASGAGTIAYYLTGIPGLNVVASELYSLVNKSPVEQR